MPTSVALMETAPLEDSITMLQKEFPDFDFACILAKAPGILKAWPADVLAANIHVILEWLGLTEPQLAKLALRLPRILNHPAADLQDVLRTLGRLLNASDSTLLSSLMSFPTMFFYPSAELEHRFKLLYDLMHEEAALPLHMVQKTVLAHLGVLKLNISDALERLPFWQHFKLHMGAPRIVAIGNVEWNTRLEEATRTCLEMQQVKALALVVAIFDPVRLPTAALVDKGLAWRAHMADWRDHVVQCGKLALSLQRCACMGGRDQMVIVQYVDSRCILLSQAKTWTPRVLVPMRGGCAGLASLLLLSQAPLSSCHLPIKKAGWLVTPVMQHAWTSAWCRLMRASQQATAVKCSMLSPRGRIAEHQEQDQLKWCAAALVVK
eukprot:jgi/Chlat1/6567/Chrsp45S06040